MSELYQSLSVLLVNSDQIDKLGVVDHPSFAFWTRSNGLSRVPRRLVSDSRRASIGDPCLAPSDWRAPTLGQAPQANSGRPLPLGLALVGLERVAIPRFHHEGRHGHRLATVRASACCGVGRFDAASLVGPQS